MLQLPHKVTTQHNKCNQVPLPFSEIYDMGIILQQFVSTFTQYMWQRHLMASSELPFLEIYDMGIILKVFLSTFTWRLWQRHLMAWSAVAFFGNIWYGYHFKVFFEYWMMSSCPIAFLVGIFDNQQSATQVPQDPLLLLHDECYMSVVFLNMNFSFAQSNLISIYKTMHA